MLKKVKFLNCGCVHTYAPPQEDAVVQTNDIVTATPTDARGEGPFVMLKFRNGDHMTVVGFPADFADATLEDLQVDAWERPVKEASQ